MFKTGKHTIIFAGIFMILTACSETGTQNSISIMEERQISFSAKNHALDNNDNFSPDDRFLCYDTRGTVFNKNLANCKSIEKIEIATGKETVLWEPESVTGEEAAPGVAAVSWHPSEEKVIFIQGPLLEEVEARGFYGIRNRTGVEVSANGKGVVTKVDMRDVSTERATINGAQRGGTHRHEYARNGKRIGFTYDDFLVQNFDRTIGYMEPNAAAPRGYTHYFAVLLKPAEMGKSKPGEIEKAYGDSWVGADGKMRAFVGKIRAENGVDYQTDLFVADIPDSVDITTAFSGDATSYPQPPGGIEIRRLTDCGTVSGIVRGSHDGKQIAYLAEDKSGILQIFVIPSQKSALPEGSFEKPFQLSEFQSNASDIRWHPSGNSIFAIADGNVAVFSFQNKEKKGKYLFLTNDTQKREELVVSNDGNTLAYTMLKTGDYPGEFRQIFVMDLNWEVINDKIK